MRGHGFRRFCGDICVAQMVMANWFQAGIAFVDKRNPIGDILADDVAAGNHVEAFHQQLDRIVAGRRLVWGIVGASAKRLGAF